MSLIPSRTARRASDPATTPTLADSRPSGRLPNDDGRLAAGVPVLLLPPRLEGTVPALEGMHLVDRADDVRRVRELLRNPSTQSVVIHGSGAFALPTHELGAIIMHYVAP